MVQYSQSIRALVPGIAFKFYFNTKTYFFYFNMAFDNTLYINCSIFLCYSFSFSFLFFIFLYPSLPLSLSLPFIWLHLSHKQTHQQNNHQSPLANPITTSKTQTHKTSPPPPSPSKPINKDTKSGKTHTNSTLPRSNPRQSPPCHVEWGKKKRKAREREESS